MNTTLPDFTMVAEDNPEITVVRISLGLTLYLDEPTVWASEGASAALGAFLQHVGSDRLEWFTTSAMTEWRRLNSETISRLRAELSHPSRGRPRHLLEVRLTDDPGAPSLGFTYLEIDPLRAQRTGVLELFLPPDREPKELLELATTMGDRWPFFCGVGGYQGVWNPSEKATAFSQIHRWCRRYIGLDVQDADQMAWQAFSGLPGSNWLTLIGTRLADHLQVELPVLGSGMLDKEITSIPLQRGLLLKAGTEPTLGDLNQLSYPAAYAEVARRLAPLFIQNPPEYWGAFTKNSDTKKWLWRLIDPAGWR